MRKHIPNAITLGNMLCGILAILLFTQFEFEWSIYLIGIAALLDFADGFVARMLKVSGDMGKQLDSLADVVSFGLAPAVGLSYALKREICSFDLGMAFCDPWITYVPLAIALFSAYRLAKFNIDTRQTDKFIGLPTPANSILILSLVWGIDHGTIDLAGVHDYLEIIIVLFTIFSSWALIAELPLLALKFKNFGWADNKPRYLLILSAIVIFALSGITGLSLVVLLYLIISIIDNRIHRHEISR